jgi:hypothetical protein
VRTEHRRPIGIEARSFCRVRRVCGPCGSRRRRSGSGPRDGGRVGAGTVRGAQHTVRVPTALLENHARVHTHKTVLIRDGDGGRVCAGTVRGAGTGGAV